MAIRHFDFALHRALTKRFAKQIAYIHHAHLAAGLTGNIQHGCGRAGIGNVKFDLLIIQLASAQLFAKHFARGRTRIGSGNGFYYPIFRRLSGLCPHIIAHLRARHRDGRINQIANDLLDISPHIAHFGELGCFNLYERGFRQFGKPAAYFGFTHARWPDHKDIFRINFIAQAGIKLFAPPARA